MLALWCWIALILVPIDARAHQNRETRAPEVGTDNSNYTTPATFFGKTFQNPKMRVHLMDHRPRTYAHGGGTTSTTGEIDWDLVLRPAGNCYAITTPDRRINLQKRDLDTSGNPINGWSTTNSMDYRSACLNGSAATPYHWLDSLGFVTQGSANFEMRLVDAVSGAVYLTSVGSGNFIVPNAPSSLLITDITTSSVRIEWLNNAEYENFYEVERRIDPSGAWTKIAQPEDEVQKGSLMSYTDPTVKAGVEYSYRVRTVNGSAFSGWSNVASTQAGIIDRERAFGDSLGINPTGELGDPVNTLTGGFVSSVTDVSLPGIGLPFVFERSYNSADATPGSMGVGWSHPFESSLTFPTSTQVKVRGSDGQRVVFSRQADGSYRGEPGTRATLTYVAGGYEVKHFDQRVDRYNTAGRLIEMRDPNGNRLTMDWSSGRLGAITDTVGRRIAITYGTTSVVTALTLPDGRSVTYGYVNGLLQTVTDIRGGTTTYSYDAAKRLTKIVDQNGNMVVTSSYNAKGRVREQLDARNNRWLYSWNSDSQTATVTDPRGNSYQDVYRGNVLRRRIDALGNVTGFDYDADLNLTTLTDVRGNSTSMTYDDRGNMLTQTAPAPLGYVEQWTYNPQNRPVSYTNARGFTTTFQYDSRGNLDLIEEPGGVVTEFVRHPVTGAIESIVDPRSKTTIFQHDAAGNLTQITNPSGAVTRYVYDAYGRVIAHIDPRGNVPGADPGLYTTTFEYNRADQIVAVADPLGNATSITHDAGGRVVAVMDAKNRSTSYGYNGANLLTSVTAPDSSTTAYVYDVAGNVIARTDAKNHTTAYTYDALNRPKSMTSPTGQRWEYAYDPASNLTSMTDAFGNQTPLEGDGITRYRYDALSRLTEVDYSDATPDVSFVYDQNDNLSSMSDGHGIESYSYDDRDHLTVVTRDTSVLGYAYDEDGNVTRRTYPDGTVSNLAYDDDGRLSTVTTGSRTTSYGYDSGGRLTSTSLPATNGHVESRTYDRAGNLAAVVTSREAEVLATTSYARDAVGNPTTVTTSSGTESYAYDARDRVTEVCYQLSCSAEDDPFIRYSYDAVGNRLSEVRPRRVTTYEYDASDQLVSSAVGGVITSYEHDPRGNLTRAGSTTYTYDLANRMTSADSATSTARYEYDGLGKRVAAVEGTGTAEVTTYLWDPNMSLPEIVREDRANGVVRRYEHGHDLISMSSDGHLDFFHHDGLGSAIAVTDVAGEGQWEYSYEPFGTVRTTKKSDDAAVENPIRFAGQYQDESGLLHLRARQYDPAQGRFLSADPMPPRLMNPATASYAYANSAPTTMADPAGLEACQVSRGGDPADAYWNVRSHMDYWDQQAAEAAIEDNAFVGFAKWAGARVLGGSLDVSGLDTVQASSETIGTACTSMYDKVTSGLSIAGVGVGWYGAVSTTATGSSKLLFGSNARNGSRIVGLRNRWGSHFYTDPYGFFFAVDRAPHYLHLSKWKPF